MLRGLIFLFAVIAFAVACIVACSTTQTTESRISVKWNVKSLSSVDSKGQVTRADVTGFFIFRSDGSYEENVVIAHLAHVQESNYSTNNNDAGDAGVGGTMSLVIGEHTSLYNYSVTADGQTMTMDSVATLDEGGVAVQDQTTNHWVLTFDSTTTGQ
jgi:hypothetical protein